MIKLWKKNAGRISVICSVLAVVLFIVGAVNEVGTFFVVGMVAVLIGVVAYTRFAIEKR
jgi:uncharacterized membrane protein